MTDDFENKVKTLLNEHVDDQVGPRRPAPPRDLPDTVRTAGAARRRAPWIMPLVAAACVAVVAGGLGVARLVADDESPRVLDQPTVSSRPQPTRTPSAPTLRTVDGARIAVPRGWTLTDAYTGVDPGSFLSAGYCLQPADKKDACVIGLYRLRPPSSSTAGYLALDVDKNDGFGLGDPPTYACNDGSADEHDAVSEIAQDSTFGGRAADLRQWTRTCKGKVMTHEIQSIVATDPGWALYSADAELEGVGVPFPQILAAFDQIAAQSVLQPASGTVRYMDRGIITAASRGSSEVSVTIDRVWSTTQGQRSVIVDRHHRVVYTVPAALYDRAEVKVGDQVALTTNGVRATVFEREIPGQ